MKVLTYLLACAISCHADAVGETRFSRTKTSQSVDVTSDAHIEKGRAYQTVSAHGDVGKMQKRSQIGHQDDIEKTHGSNSGGTGMVEGALQRKGGGGSDGGGSCSAYECMHVCGDLKKWVEDGYCQIPYSDARRRSNLHYAPSKATACSWSFSKVMTESGGCTVNGYWPGAVHPCFQEGSNAERAFAEYCASSLMEDNKSDTEMVQRAHKKSGSSVNGSEREWSEKQKKAGEEALDDSLEGKCN